MTIASAPASLLRDRRGLLSAIALLLALGEIADAFFVSFPAGPGVFAALLLAGTLWIRRGGIGGPLLVAALFAFEIANAPFWPRQTTGDWISTVAYGVVALAGLLVAIAVIKLSINKRTTRTTAARSEA
jgi:hypothetical protein